MAVPSSGTLTMQGLAQEALYGTYGSGTITSPIHLYDLVNGGNSAGSGNSYPTVNQSCTPNPADRTALTLTDVWISNNPGVYFTLYYNSSIGVAANLDIGDYIYTDSSLTTPAVAPNNSYHQVYGSASTQHCSGINDEMDINSDSTGKIIYIACPLY